MPPRTDPNAQATRQALLDAGLYCFSEQGFEGTSLRMIAERAGRPVSLIAHHFGNKEGLYLAVFRDMLARPRCGQFEGPVIPLEALAGHPERASQVLRDLMVRIFVGVRRAVLDSDPRYMAHFRLWMTAFRAPIPELEPLMRERLTPLRTQIAACIQAMRPDFPAAEIPFWCALVYGQCVSSTMMHDFNQLVFGPDCYPDSIELLAERIADLTLRAIAAGAPPSPEASKPCPAPEFP